MDKLSLLQKRKKQLIDAGKAIRADVNALIDEDSFVEFSCFSFSKSEFYGERLSFLYCRAEFRRAFGRRKQG